MQKKSKKVEDKEFGLPEKQEKLNQKPSTPITEDKKPKKQLEVRSVPGCALYEVKFQGGGEQPKPFKEQRWTTKLAAKAAIEKYLEGK